MNKDLIEQKLNIDPQALKAYSSGLLQGKAYSGLYKSLTKTLVPFNLSIPEWKLLGQLHENQALKLNILADLLSYDPPMVTKLAKSLEKKEFAKRVQDKLDERAKIIEITPQGRKLIERIEPNVKEAMSQVLKGVTREELLIYIKILVIIVNNS